MRKILLTMLAVVFGVTLSYAESCSKAGATEKKYTAEGNCDYKTQTRTCCEDGEWSDWDKECSPSTCNGCMVNGKCENPCEIYGGYLIGKECDNSYAPWRGENKTMRGSRRYACMCGVTENDITYDPDIGGFIPTYLGSPFHGNLKCSAHHYCGKKRNIYDSLEECKAGKESHATFVLRERLDHTPTVEDCDNALYRTEGRNITLLSMPSECKNDNDNFYYSEDDYCQCDWSNEHYNGKREIEYLKTLYESNEVNGFYLEGK